MNDITYIYKILPYYLYMCMCARTRGGVGMRLSDQIRRSCETKGNSVSVGLNGQDNSENQRTSFVPLDQGAKVRGEERECVKWCGTTGCGLRVESCELGPDGEDESEGKMQDFKPNYARLLDAGVDDFRVDCLSAAMFLFAIGKVRSCAQYEFEEMCGRYVPYWRKRLDAEAWEIVAGEIRRKGLAKPNIQAALMEPLEARSDKP